MKQHLSFMLHKKILSATLLLLVMLPLFCFAQSKKIPALRFTDTENTLVSNKDIPKGKALMLIYFRSDCDHCEHTAQQLKTTAAKYPVTIWMVSAEPLPTLRTFEEMMGLYDFDNLTVMQDHTQSMHRWFDFEKLPFIVLFDKSGKELKIFDELPTVETIKKILTTK
ncbi:MAG: redoxin domain-containing protein [Taibaiella sp.]